MSKVPDVTFVVATAVRPAWLAVAVRSIQLSAAVASSMSISSTIVVVDDGPPGTATRDVCATLGVTYVRNPVPDGRPDPSAARLLGLERVESPYFAFFDDDDVMLARFVHLHVTNIREGHDVVYSTFWITDQELRPMRRHRQLPLRLGDLLADHNMVNDHCLMRTETCANVWDPDLEKAMPFGAWLELAYRGRSFSKLDEPTYLYRRHGDNMSAHLVTDPRMLELREQLMQRYRYLVVNRDGCLPRRSARLALHQATPTTAKALYRQALRFRPGV